MRAEVKRNVGLRGRHGFYSRARAGYNDDIEHPAVALGAHAGGGDATKKRIEITVERQRVTFIRRKGLASGWCAACGQQVWMVTPEEAALLAGVTARTIYRRVEGGSIHFTESADGTLLICADSIAESI